MGLYERLLGLEEPKIPVHQYNAAMNEIQRGHLTQDDVAAMFKLDPTEKSDSDGVAGRRTAVFAPISGDELHDVLMLAERGLAYGDVASLKARLGVA